METKNREKLYLMIVVAAICLYVLNAVVIDPLTASWKNRQTDIAKLKSQIQDGHDTMDLSKSIESKWNGMFTNTLPVNPTMAEATLFKAFQTWAVNSGVSLVAQKPEKKDADDPDAGYKNEEWHSDVTGNLNQIFNFLYAVESSPMGLRVDSIELSSRDDRGIQLALGLTVSGLILSPSTNSVP